MYNITIERKTSQYNKYMLWKITGIATETKAKFIDYTKTLKQAIERSTGKNYKIIKITK